MGPGERDALELLRNVMIGSVREQRPDLTARQLAVLLIVALEAGPHTVRGLAGRLSIAKPAVTRALDALARNDFIRRRPDEDDLRSVFVERTPAGTAFLRSFITPVTGTPKLAAAAA